MLLYIFIYFSVYLGFFLKGDIDRDGLDNIFMVIFLLKNDGGCSLRSDDYFLKIYINIILFILKDFLVFRI